MIKQSKDRVLNKINRRNSLKPFLDLEKSLKQADLETILKKNGNLLAKSDQPTFNFRSNEKITRWDMNKNEFIKFD